jgi:hypothetical protein
VQRACTLLPGKTTRRLAGGSSLMMPAASWIKGPRPASANGAVESRTGGWGAMLHNSMLRAAVFEVDDRRWVDIDARVESASISSLLARDRVRRRWGR